MTDYAPTTTTGLLTLWDFNQDSEDTVIDQAAAGGLENGQLFGDAEAEDGKLELDGDEGVFVAGPDDDWQLDEGRIELVFNQDDHSGSGADTLLSRDSRNFDDGGHLNIAVTRNGKVEVRHQTEDESFTFKTPSDFFSEGDDVRVTYAWDSDGDDGFYKVENLTTGDVYEEEICIALTLDQGPDFNEPITVGASQRVSDDNSVGPLSQFFEGEIAYVAIYDTAAVEEPPLTGPDFVVEGTSGADVIDVDYDEDPDGDMIDAGDNATGGNEDVVDAGAGDDIVEAGDAEDTVFAGTGDDSVLGEGGNDVIFGDTALSDTPLDPTETEGAGDDTLIGGAGDDLIFGETGDDSIEGNSGDDTLFGDDPAEGTPIGPNLIFNGSFEDTTGLETTGFGFQSEDGIIAGWTDSTGEEIDVHNDGRGGLDATDGENWLDLEASPGNNQIGQDVQGVVDGDTYRLTFDAGDGNFLPGSGPDENLVTVLWGGEVIAELDPSQGSFDSFEFDVIGGAGDGSNRLEFQGSGQLDKFGVSIDNVSLVLLAGPEGAGGDDTIDGGAGDDVIDGQGGNDELIGGTGSDTITDLDGDNLIDAGPLGTPDLGFPFVGDADSDPDDDRDSVVTGAGDDTISTGDDADTIEAGDGDNVIDGGFDADEISSGTGDDEIIGGEGSDTIISGAGDDTIFGGVAEDVVNLIDDNVDPDNNDPIPGNDIDSLSNGDDLINAGAGDDVVFGEDDDDTIDGGTGDDTLDGGIDDDVITGGAGDDSIIGGQGKDDLSGGTGDDTFKVGNFVDPVFGDVYAEGIGDTIVGGEDPDDGDEDVLDLSTAGPLKIVFDDDVDPGGQTGESGKVFFFEDDTKTTIVGELEFSQIENVIPCFTPGTRIATPTGEVPVESLKEGDKVITRDNGIQEIRWAGHRTLNRAELMKAPNMRPILIKAGSLGQGLPERDMLVSPQHRVLVSGEKTQLYFEESEVLVAAKHLLNAGSIRRIDTLRTTYIHFMFDRHEVVLSDGAWTESFQPGDQSLGGMGKDQRNEIFELFPELVTKEGITAYQAARRALKSHEAKLLQF